MEVVQETEKEIIFQDRSSFGCVFLFLVFPFVLRSLGLSLLILSEMGVIKVSCQRVEPTQVNCQVNSSKYLGLIQGSSNSLTRVTEAKFNSQNDSYGSNYFVTLVTQTGKEVVSWQGNSYTNGVKGYPQEMNEMVEKINTFIKNSTEPSLLIQYDIRWKWKNLMSLALNITFIGIAVLLLGKPYYLKIITLNKSEGQLTYKISSLLGLYTKTKHYSFAQIKELILDSDTNSDGDKFYSLELVLPAENQNNQLKVPLRKYYDIERSKKAATILSDFIEIPYQDLSNE
ncbi:hypothetical protein [Okeania sp. SIO2B3]|uniref:hypothetical protein n=1 Tax=Okeania sp. SIO2B3 TaxID=2607784 RepID=UPI0013BFF7F3|nr:hypothetical protein [Okeania sp. SIO2B3]NET41611.1 hypothetical protein [Okeania sp. SIO2B3]